MAILVPFFKVKFYEDIKLLERHISHTGSKSHNFFHVPITGPSFKAEFFSTPVQNDFRAKASGTGLPAAIFSDQTFQFG
jgi:hypothetical protein